MGLPYGCEFCMDYRATDNICSTQLPWLICCPLLICYWGTRVLQFPKMALVTDQLGNGSLGFVNVCLGLIQQSRRSYGNVDLMIFFLPGISNFTYDYFRLSPLSCIKSHFKTVWINCAWLSCNKSVERMILAMFLL